MSNINGLALVVGKSHGTLPWENDQSTAILAEIPCEATRLAGFDQIPGLIAESDNDVARGLELFRIPLDPAQSHHRR